jgi:glycosyltransferase involved in cell wall biosynthesis
MRILFVTHRFLPRYTTGTEAYTAALAREVHARGHAVQIFTGDPMLAAPEHSQWGGLPVETVPWGLGGMPGPVGTFLAGFGNPAVEARFKALVRVFQPDIVHIQHLVGLSPRLIALARRAGARVVVTLHDFWFVCSNTWLYRWNGQLCPGPGWGYACGGCALHRLGRRAHPVPMALAAPLFAARTAVLRRALLGADRVLAPSETVARHTAEQGFPADRIQVLPHGLSTPRAASVAAAGRPPRFIAIGSLIPAKGAHVIVEAFNGISRPDAELWLYGDDQADPDYTAALRRLARHPGIAFKGRLEHSEVPAALSAAAALLLPSLWYEAYSIVVDEALGAGLPVVVSDHGAPAERLRPDVDSLFAPPGDAVAWRGQIQRLLDEPELLPRLRAGIRPPLGLAEHVTEIEAVYAAALAQGRRT